MPSHAYFHARPEVADWEADDPREHTAEGDQMRQRIADALLETFPGMERIGPNLDEHGKPGPWVALYVSHLEVTVFLTFVHVRLGWHTREEMDEMRLVPTLHRMHEVLTEVAGFDMFEHGCQGLDVEGDIDLVPDFIAPTNDRISSVFGGGIRTPVEPILMS